MVRKTRIVAAMAALLIAAAGVITFEACNKKNDVVKDIPELRSAELSDMDKEMILFGEKLKSAKKGEETMELTEAVRNLSNYQNFKMSNAGIFSVNMERYTLESEIPVKDGKVYLSDLNTLYQNNRNNIVEKLRSLEGEDKNIYCIYSRINKGGKDDGEVRIVTDAYMFGSVDNPSPYYFDEDLCWVVDPYDCTDCTGGLAIDVLNNRARLIMGSPECPAGFRPVLYDQIEKYTWASNYPDTNSPNGVYALIHGDYEDECLSASDMRYYLDVIIDILSGWSSEQSQYGRVLTFIQYISFNDTCLYAIYSRVDCSSVGNDI